MNGDDHSPLVQAALTHAQFETIHPFADGNGRTGRALIHVVLHRRGLVTRFVPPISLVLATWASAYVAGLTSFRHLGDNDSHERSAGTTDWLRLFAAATNRSCVDAEQYSADIAAVNAAWRVRLGRVRANSSTELLLGVLRSKARTTDAVNALAEVGILQQRNVGRQRYRVFEATDVLELFTGLERALASPSGNTMIDQPNRRVPRRPTS